MRVIFDNLLKSESGVTAIEYAFIAGLIAIFVVSALAEIGTALSTKFNVLAGG
ncbi:MAG: Flp family type IVb pilin, partial [Bradyrhizobium sp.]